MALTDTAIKKAQSTDKMQKLSDGGGLQLHIAPTGGKLWRLAYRFDGKQKTMALGVYPEVSLAHARERRDAARKLLATGADPMARRKADRQIKEQADENTFEAVARAWWAHWSSGKSPRHAGYLIRRLEADIFPVIGARPIDSLQAPELVALVKGIASRGAVDLAKRAHQTTGQIFRYAIAHGRATRNPATDVKPGDVLPARKKENYARVGATELPVLLRKIEAYQGTPATRLAIKLMTLTFVRTGELIAARWSEFDLEAARWDIPAERMKMRTPRNWHHNSSSSVAPPMRSEACHSGGTSSTVDLIRIC